MCIPLSVIEWSRVLSDVLLLVAVCLGLWSLWKGQPEGRDYQWLITENTNGEPSPPPKVKIRLRTALWWSLAGIGLLLLADLATAARIVCD